jgi:hypothetical protein
MNFICCKCRRRTPSPIKCNTDGCTSSAFVFDPIKTKPAKDWEVRKRLCVRPYATPLGAFARFNQQLVK